MKLAIRCGAGLVFLITPPLTAADYTYKIIAQNDQPVPELGPGFQIFAFAFPSHSINNAGDICFMATARNGDLDHSVVWKYADGDLSVVVHDGMVMESLPGAPAMQRLFEFGMSDDGVVGLVGRVAPVGSQSFGEESILIADSGMFTLLAQEGMQAPGLPPGRLLDDLFGTVSLQDFAFGTNGGIGFVAEVNTSALNDSGIWYATGGTLHKAIFEGEYLETSPISVRLGDMDNDYEPSINASGEIAFRANLTVGGSLNHLGVLTTAGGGLRIVSRDGLPVPGLSAEFEFNTAIDDKVLISDAGAVAFAQQAEIPGVPGSQRLGIWLDANGALREVAVDGAPTPHSNGAEYDDVNTIFAMNRPGDVLFSASTIDPIEGIGNLLAIDRAGQQEVLLTDSMPAPGLADGVNFASFIPGALNDNGDCLFSGILQGPGVFWSNRISLWSRSADGDLRFILRQYGTIVFEDGESGVLGGGVPSLHPFFESGSLRSFNNAGSIVMSLQFDGGLRAIVLATPCSKGDMNEDGARDGTDLNLFVDSLIGAEPAYSRQGCAADVNHDNIVSGDDVQGFVNLLTDQS